MLNSGTQTSIPPFPANERDPTGAGDCFLAGFAAGIARGLDPIRAARIGAYCGARAVEQILVDAQLRTRLSAGGKNAAGRLGWDEPVDAMERIYAELAAGRAVVGQSASRS